MLSWEQRIERAGETVTVTKGFLWWKRQQNYIRGFTQQDTELARDWACCPNGQADPRIERLWNPANPKDLEGCGMPADAELRSLGLKFYTAICANHIDKAMIVYRKIQYRVAQLVEEIEKKESKQTNRNKKTKQQDCVQQTSD